MTILEEMASCAKRVYGPGTILARMCFTQAVLESNWGKSVLSRQYNNFFGIKGKGTKGSVNLRTKEEMDGVQETLETTRDNFAVYSSMKESFDWHARLMAKTRYRPVLEAGTLDEAFIQLYKCGYATDPKYPEKLSKLYFKHLRQYV